MYKIFSTKEEAQNYSRAAFIAPQGVETQYQYAIVESPLSELCACITEEGLTEEEFSQREDFWGISEEQPL